jgi:Domain of unknown function (DUF2017)
MGIFRSERRISGQRDGTFALALPDNERQLLRELVGQLRDVLLATTEDPTLRRLFPTAYPNDAERDREYQVLVRDELLAKRLAALDIVEETVSATELDEEQVTAWMGALNDLRLVLGTRLDVDEQLPELDADDPLAPAYAVYEYLGFLLSEVVDALSDRL